MLPSLVESTSKVPDTDELAHFRERWKEEIRERGQQPQEFPSDPSQSQPAQRDLTTSNTSSISRLQSALETYARAITEEQNGNHAEATRLYRNAFRLDSNVDKAYHREELTYQRLRNISTPSSLPPQVSNISLEDTKSQATSQVILTSTTLISLLESWPQPLLFAPEDEARGAPISRLPDEIICKILLCLAHNVDVSTIERFAIVNRRARVLSLDTSLWRRVVKNTIVPQQLSDPTITLPKLTERYRCDYRRLFIEHPRLRFDGVYISICHYVRNGLSENPWVTVSHLITYRRFLRFLPNGEVISYRANEDQDISDVVRALQPGYHRKDLCIGAWQLTGTRVFVTDLVDKTPTPPGHSGSDKYSFQMRLTLKSRPSLGRWNKLDFLGYESVNLQTGETYSFPLRHERPYWFSKVRSYQYL
ncbi:hypothetical protein K439DRAFT_1420045 [Ramaria rubella]|nr:hypothetical protein K439DRAFT_1420045 [Ramaria rubella]